MSSRPFLLTGDVSNNNAPMHGSDIIAQHFNGVEYLPVSVKKIVFEPLALSDAFILHLTLADGTVKRCGAVHLNLRCLEEEIG
jgi:hypothetical protein